MVSLPAARAAGAKKTSPLNDRMRGEMLELLKTGPKPMRELAMVTNIDVGKAVQVSKPLLVMKKIIVLCTADDIGRADLPRGTLMYALVGTAPPEAVLKKKSALTPPAYKRGYNWTAGSIID